MGVFHILEKNLFRKLETFVKSDTVISVISESRSRIAHSFTEAEQPVDTVLEDNLDDIYQDEILYTLLPQESTQRRNEK